MSWSTQISNKNNNIVALIYRIIVSKSCCIFNGCYCLLQCLILMIFFIIYFYRAFWVVDLQFGNKMAELKGYKLSHEHDVNGKSLRWMNTPLSAFKKPTIFTFIQCIDHFKIMYQHYQYTRYVLVVTGKYIFLYVMYVFTIYGNNAWCKTFQVLQVLKWLQLRNNLYNYISVCSIYVNLIIHVVVYGLSLMSCDF